MKQKWLVCVALHRLPSVSAHTVYGSKEQITSYLHSLARDITTDASGRKILIDRYEISLEVDDNFFKLNIKLEGKPYASFTATAGEDSVLNMASRNLDENGHWIQGEGSYIYVDDKEKDAFLAGYKAGWDDRADDSYHEYSLYNDKERYAEYCGITQNNSNEPEAGRKE